MRESANRSDKLLIKLLRRPDWVEWAQAEGEEREGYVNRLRDTFHFRRKDTPASLVTEVFSLGHGNKGPAAQLVCACAPVTCDVGCSSCTLCLLVS